MNTHTLKYFLAVLEEQSISKAAQKNFITQQTMSGYIKRLEQEYNAQLFEREPKMHPTEAGRCLEKYARQILKIEKQLTNHLGDLAEDQAGQLCLGLTPTRAKLILPQILPAFNHAHPKIELAVQIDSFRSLEEKLINGDIDLLIATTRPTLNYTSQYALYTDPFCLVVPANLLNQYALTPAMDKSMAFTQLLPLLQTAPFVQMIISTIKMNSDHFFQEQNLTPKVLLSLHDLDTVLELAMMGLGYAFSFQEYAEKKAFQLFHTNQENYPLILPLPGKDSKVVIAARKDAKLTHSAKLFIEGLQTLYKKIQPS